MQKVKPRCFALAGRNWPEIWTARLEGLGSMLRWRDRNKHASAMSLPLFPTDQMPTTFRMDTSVWMKIPIGGQEDRMSSSGTVRPPMHSVIWKSSLMITSIRNFSRTITSQWALTSTRGPEVTRCSCGTRNREASIPLRPSPCFCNVTTLLLKSMRRCHCY